MVDLSIFFWFVVLMSPYPVSAQLCSRKSGVFTTNGPYDLNRRAMLSSLPSGVTDHNGYNTTSTGKHPDIAYGLGMCIQHANNLNCSNCIKSASETLLEKCPNQIEAIIWKYDDSLCLVRYSNRLFYGSFDDEMVSAVYRNYPLEDIQANLTQFETTWQGLTLRLIHKARWSSFASAQVVGPFFSIYGIMQCSKDLTFSGCTECLQDLVNTRPCCRAVQGGSFGVRGCFMRWDLYPFLGLFKNTILPTPPSKLPNSKNNTTQKDGKNMSTEIIAAIVVIPICMIIVLLALGFTNCRRRIVYVATEDGYFSVARRPMPTYGTAAPTHAADDTITSSGSHRFEFRAIKAATNNFQKSNKLGHGGFGAVYKGIFPNGTEVAAKRLSRTSDQGEQEFKNEVLLVAKLQHQNLVRLLGFSVEGEEKILVYEFLPNKSLDYFLFDPLKRAQLDWTRRLNIIEGITRGILYLHQDSRPRVIHRDLKASNILLDADMNPKIADFGMARNIRVNQTEANTSRVVGTFGYMPPEYVANGHFSTKSDVYSFGVLILEIIGCKKNSSFHRIDGSVSNLVSYVWRLWNNQSLLELVDPTIGENYDKDEVIRCIHIGLLCVQENPADRPSMSKIFQMLTNASSTLSVPKPPGFFFRERSEQNPLAERLLPGPSTNMSYVYSVDDDTSMITIVSPR